MLSSFKTALISSEETDAFRYGRGFDSGGVGTGRVYLLESSSLFVRFRELTPRFRLARLMKDDRVSLGLQPGSGTDAAFERPGTFSRRS